jgi:hypothetical protein
VKVFNQSNLKSLITAGKLFVPPDDIALEPNLNCRFQNLRLKPSAHYALYRPLKGTAMILFVLTFIAVGFNRRGAKRLALASAKFRRFVSQKNGTVGNLNDDLNCIRLHTPFSAIFLLYSTYKSS